MSTTIHMTDKQKAHFNAAHQRILRALPDSGMADEELRLRAKHLRFAIRFSDLNRAQKAVAKADMVAPHLGLLRRNMVL